MSLRNTVIAAAVLGVGLWAASPAQADPTPTPGPVQHTLDRMGDAADKAGTAADKASKAADDAETDAVMDETVAPIMDGVEVASDTLTVLDWATD